MGEGVDLAADGFASLGGHRGRTSNMERDLGKFLKGAFNHTLQEQYVDLTVWGETEEWTKVSMRLPILRPVHVVDQMARCGEGTFLFNLLGNRPQKHNLQLIWEHVRKLSFGQRHPHLQRSEEFATKIPVSIHGDNARVYYHSKLLILSWTSSIVRGCSWDSRNLFAVIPWEVLIPGLSLQQLLAHFAREINALQNSKVVVGCKSYTFAYFGSKGDLEWHVYAYNLPRYYRCNFLCHRCFASKVDELLLFTNVADDAPFLSTIVRTDDFLNNAKQISGQIPSLCEIEGWSTETQFWDMMHNLYQGNGNDAAASGIVVLRNTKYYGAGDDAQQFAGATKSLRDFCKASHVRCGVPAFDKNMLNCGKNTVYPTMSGKAAHVKVVLRWLSNEFYIASVLPETVLKHCAVLFHALAQFTHILAHAPLVLDQATADQACYYGLRYLVVYKYLAISAYQSRQRLWKIRPKNHYIMHTCLEMKETLLNPFCWTCFMDEDFMGKVKRLSQKCHRRTVSLRTIQRYRLLVAVRWHRRAKKMSLKRRRRS